MGLRPPKSPKIIISGINLRNQCHDRANAEYNNFIRHIKNRFSPHFIFNAVWALTSDGFRIVSDTLVTDEITAANSSSLLQYS